MADGGADPQVAAVAQFGVVKTFREQLRVEDPFLPVFDHFDAALGRGAQDQRGMRRRPQLQGQFKRKQQVDVVLGQQRRIAGLVGEHQQFHRHPLQLGCALDQPSQGEAERVRLRHPPQNADHRVAEAAPAQGLERS